jgi:DNA primase
MSNNTQKIKERLNIVDVVSQYVKLDRAGVNLKGRCPFHNEKTPSFFVSPDRGTYKCFGCGAGGDIFTFTEQFEGVDFVGALKILAEKAGIELEKEDPKKRDEKEKLFFVMEEATVFFEKNLKENSEAIKYLENRGLKKDTIEKFRIGYVKEGWRSLNDFLKTKNISDEIQEKVGLIKQTEKGYYDRFRGRIIFPMFDNSGRVIAFSGRLFVEEEGKDSAKYLNSPETVLFNKSKVLYGYNFAKNDIRKRDFSILVEGQMDITMSHQAGFTNTIATSGTALTSEHLLLLSRLSNKIAMAFDGDEAGLRAANKGAKMALSMGMEVKLVQIPENSDPADLILKDKNSWIKSLQNSVHIIDFNLNSLLTKDIDERKLRLEIGKIVLPLVLSVKSSTERSHFVSKIALSTGIKEDIIWDELNKIDENDDHIQNDISDRFLSYGKEKSSQLKKKAIREISGILYWQKSLEKFSLNIKENQEKLKFLVGEDVFDKIQNLPNETVSEIIFEAENMYAEAEDLETKIKELFNNLEKEILREERNNLDKNDLKKIDEISRKIEQLK